MTMTLMLDRDDDDEDEVEDEDNKIFALPKNSCFRKIAEMGEKTYTPFRKKIK